MCIRQRGRATCATASARAVCGTRWADIGVRRNALLSVCARPRMDAALKSDRLTCLNRELRKNRVRAGTSDLAPTQFSEFYSTRTQSKPQRQLHAACITQRRRASPAQAHGSAIIRRELVASIPRHAGLALSRLGSIPAASLANCRRPSARDICPTARHSSRLRSCQPRAR